jgi:formylglycine-generating enzyme required for sulfatase activity
MSIARIAIIAAIIPLSACLGGGGGGGGGGADASSPPPAFAVLAIATGTITYQPASFDPATAASGSIVFSRIPAQSATLGSTRPWLPDETQRVVDLPACWIAVTELTQAQWIAVAGSTPWTALGPDTAIGSTATDPGLPAYGLSRDEVDAAFAAYGKAQLHLPSDDQWEAAARAGTATDYPWGDGGDLPSTAATTWSFDSGASPGSGPVAVGTRTANAYRLRDVLGNVAEYVSGGGATATLRGGGWSSGGLELRFAARWVLPSNRRHACAGVRPVLVAP